MTLSESASVARCKELDDFGSVSLPKRRGMGGERTPDGFLCRRVEEATEATARTG